MVESDEEKMFVFYLADGFALMDFSVAIESLRLVNTALGRDVYRWRIASLDGRPVRASCGFSFPADTSVSAERLSVARTPPFMTLVYGGGDTDISVPVLEAWIRESYSRKVKIGGICGGTFTLARAGILNRRRCSLHWALAPAFSETFPTVELSRSIVEIDQGIYTAAGGASLFDMMMIIIGEDFGETTVANTCELAIVDRVRSPGERQRIPLTRRLNIQNETVLNVIAAMEANLVEPLSPERLCKHIGLSRRQIERLFNIHMGCSPARFYTRLRLERARLMLLKTGLPVIEIAVACGFISSSHFSKSYREEYGESPGETRTPRAGAPQHSGGVIRHNRTGNRAAVA